MQIAIIYDSGFGHTAKQAQAVADGEIAWDALEASDAIIFASPTYNSLVSAKFKKFMEDSTRAAWLP